MSRSAPEVFFASQYPPRISTFEVAYCTLPVLAVAAAALTLLAGYLTWSGILPPATILIESLPFTAFLLGPSVSASLALVSLSAPWMINLVVVAGGTLLVSVVVLFVVLVAHAVLRPSNAAYLKEQTRPPLHTPNEVCEILQTMFDKAKAEMLPGVRASCSLRYYTIANEYHPATGQVCFWLSKYPGPIRNERGLRKPVKVKIMVLQHPVTARLTVGLPDGTGGFKMLELTEKPYEQLTADLINACDEAVFPPFTRSSL